MESLQVGGSGQRGAVGGTGAGAAGGAATGAQIPSKRSSRSGSPGAVDSIHHEPWKHHKTQSRDMSRDFLAPTALSPMQSEESPARRVSELSPGVYQLPGSALAANMADDYSPLYAVGADGDTSALYTSGDDADGSGAGGLSARAAAAITHLNTKVARTRELIRLEQTIRDDNVNEYLKLASGADKQQQQRIKAVFEKKNQKSAHSIAQLQKKLDGYNKRIHNWEQHGSAGGQGAHRQPREVLRDMGQGLKNMGGNIRDGITGLGGSVMAAPREFAHLLTRAGRFGSADNITQLAAPPQPELRANASSEGSRGSCETEAARGSTLPRAAPAAPAAPDRKSTPEASPSSSVTSESGAYGRARLHEPAYSLKTILGELRERRDDFDRLAEKIDALKSLSADVSFLGAALQEERFRTDRLEEQVNDLTELHQNEVENLKQALADVEEKVQYQSEERIRDLHEALDLCQTKILKLEQAGGGGAGGGGAGGDGAALGELPPRVVLVKLLNVALALLQLLLLLAATVAGVAMPFLRTRVRVLTTCLVVLAGALLLQQWGEVALLSSQLLRRWRLYLEPDR